MVFRVGFYNFIKLMRHEPRYKHGERHPHFVVTAPSFERHDKSFHNTTCEIAVLHSYQSASSGPFFVTYSPLGAGCKASPVSSTPLQPSPLDTCFNF
jgi:hypothetical protein